MANNVYDPDVDEQGVPNRAEEVEGYDPQKTPLGDASDPRGDLSKQEKSGFFNPGGDQASEATESEPAGSPPASLKGAENAPGGLYNPNESAGGLQRTRNRIRKLWGNKWLVGGLAGGSIGIIGFFLILILLAGSLKIPNLAQHILQYQFAKVVRQFAQSSDNITQQKLVVDSLDDGPHSRLRAKYQSLRNDTWGKLDRYRPQKVIDTMTGKNGGLKLNYEKTVTGRDKLTGVVLNDRTFPVKSQDYTHFVPGLRGAIQFRNNLSFSRDFAPALTASLKADQVGPIVRGQVAKKIRQELGISLIAWTAGKYTGKTADKARLIQERDVYKAVADEKVDPLKTSPLKNAAEQGKEAEKQSVNNDEKLRTAIANGGLVDDSVAAIEKNVTGSAFKDALGIVNSTYGVAMASCIVYDGSLTQSGPTIDSQSASQQKAFYYLTSAADQQKTGETTGEAVGAFNDKLGDITTSNPEIRASGGKVDTTTSLSSQTSTGGDYSIINALLPNNVVGAVLDIGASSACPFLTSTEGALVGAAAAVILMITSGGGTNVVGHAVGEVTETASKSFAQRFVTRLAEQFGSRQAAKQTVGNIGAKARFIAKDTTKSGVKIASTTILAKLIVMSKMHSLNNGLEQGTDFANMADSGGNQAGSEVSKRQFYGRPLTDAEAGKQRTADLAYIQVQNKKTSAYDRYIALDNPSSLLNHTAVLSANALHNSIGTSLTTLASKLLSPLASVGNLFSSLVAPRVVAESSYSAVRSDYGNVQWGYSDEEMALLKNDKSYRPLENQEALDGSGQADAIESKYGKCFDGSKQIGDMLAAGDIVRNKDGSIKEHEGLCSPFNLSVHNNEFGPQMVFRWRVSHNYSNTLDQLIDQQEITTADNTPSALASATVNVADLGKSSDNLQCAEGTKDLGVATSRYRGSYNKEPGPMKIRLCQVPDIPGNGNDKNGNLISGGAVVEARVSGAWVALAKKAKADGVGLTSSSSFRLADSCGGTGNGVNCALPGQSAHQTGWAIDFADMGGFTATGSPASCAGRMTYNSPQWKWMKENAEAFGIKQYSAESWHWDFIPASNRCGSNG